MSSSSQSACLVELLSEFESDQAHDLADPVLDGRMLKAYA